LYSVGLNNINHSILTSLQQCTKGHPSYLLPIVKKEIQGGEDSYLYAREAYHRCNKNLKQVSNLSGLNLQLSTYWARYTWANVARTLGYSKDMIAEALGHSYGNRVTGIYLEDYPNEEIDEMNDIILRSVFESPCK